MWKIAMPFMSAPLRRQTALAALFTSLLAGSLSVCLAASPVPVAEDRVAAPSFAAWQRDFRDQALDDGIAADLFDLAFTVVHPDPAVLRADQSQPEFTRPVWAYLDSAISPQRLATGRQLLSSHASTLDAIEQRYGVDRHVLVAI